MTHDNTFKSHLCSDLYTEDEQKQLMDYFEEKGTFDEVEHIYHSSLELIEKYFGKKEPHFSIVVDWDYGDNLLFMTFESGIDDVDELCNKEHDFLIDLARCEEHFPRFVTIGADLHFNS